MDEGQARLRLERMIAADVDPILSGDDVDDLLELAKRADEAGRAPTDADWEPTWDLNAAAAEGWRTKAGRVVPRFGVTLDGDSLQRQQIYLHCIRQASEYAKKLAGSVGVSTVTRTVSQ